MRDLAAQLRHLAAQDLLRIRRVTQARYGPDGEIDGGQYLAFCSNDYLGLAGDQRLVQALGEGARRYGVGAGASHLVSGHHRVHQQLEERLAAFVGFPRTLLFSSGYAANLAIVPVLAGSGSEIFADRLNHASLVDGMLLSRARFRRFPHLDLDALETMLSRSRAEEKVVVTDAVFSMDGDIAPLDRISALCAQHGAWLVVDDAHGFGVLGPQGRGCAAAFGIQQPHVVYMGTLGKAAGVAGAFVAGADSLIEMLVQRARTYIYTTASPPALAYALLAAIDIIEQETWRRQRLEELVAQLRKRLQYARWKLLPSTTPIQPLMIGASKDALELAARLERAGILVPAMRPPTVPRGTARLRISLSAAHCAADVDRLADALSQAERQAA